MICVIEGLPGAGKTELAKHLSNYFDGVYITEIIKEKPRQATNVFYRENDALKYKQAFENNRKLVFMDRNYLSTLAYNYSFDYLYGTNYYRQVQRCLSRLKKLNLISEPDLYIFLDISISVSLQRQKNADRKQEWKNKDFLLTLKKFYKEKLQRLVTTNKKISVYNIRAKNIKKAKEKSIRLICKKIKKLKEYEGIFKRACF